MTILEKCNKFPPFLCRLVARKVHGRQPMTNAEIARKSGLSIANVDKLARARNWNHCTLKTVAAFAMGCGVDLLRPRRHLDYLRRRKKAQWQASKAHSKYVARLLKGKGR